jgi:hypothetical protein
VKDAAGHVYQEGKVDSTRRELDAWVETLPQPRMIAMEATTNDQCFAHTAFCFRLKSRTLAVRRAMTSAAESIF